MVHETKFTLEIYCPTHVCLGSIPTGGNFLLNLFRFFLVLAYVDNVANFIGKHRMYCLVYFHSYPENCNARLKVDNVANFL